LFADPIPCTEDKKIREHTHIKRTSEGAAEVGHVATADVQSWSDQRANTETADEEKGHRGGAQVQAGRGPPPSAPAQRLPESAAQPALAAQPASRRKVADDGPHPPN
jgi:hypothetical protein